MKKLFILFFISSKVYSQSVISLNVEKIGQKRLNWCWSASLEMILKYNNINNDDQFSIFQKYHNIIFPNSFKYKCDDCKESGTPCFSEGLSSYNSSPLCSKNENFKNLFALFDFNDIIDTCTNYTDCPPLAFDILKNEIDNHRPVILQFLRTDFDGQISESSFNHYVIASGYLETKNQNFLLIEDPWELCNGCSYMLDYNSINDNSGNVTKFISSVYNIYPRVTIDIDLINSKKKSSAYYGNIELSKYIKNSEIKKNNFISNYLNVIESINKNLSQNNFNNEEEFKKIKVYELNSNDLNNVKKDFQIEMFSKKHFLFYGIKNSIVINFAKKINQKPLKQSISKFSYKICKIFSTEYYYLESLGDFCSFLSSMALRNYINVQDFKIDFLITFPNLNYLFGCFNKGNEVFCFSKVDIPEIGIKKDSLIKQNDLLKKIQAHYKNIKF